ncbi:MAG: effector-associated domain EAD1-containing protein [Chloroflexota bacterium]
MTQLTGDQYGNLRDALCDAFPSQADLAQMTRIKLEKILPVVATGGNLQEIVCGLINLMEAEGRILELIKRAYESRPGNLALRKFMQEFKSETGADLDPKPVNDGNRPALPSYQLVGVHNFDLRQLADQCLEILLDKHGLVIFAVPCSSRLFLRNLCKRLKQDMGQNNVLIKDTIVIQLPHTSVSLAIDTIKRYKRLLQTHYVLLDVQVVAENDAKKFWQALQEEFPAEWPTNLIVITAIGENCIVPSGIFELTPPQFRKVDIHHWVREVVNRQNWPDRFISQWSDWFVAECKHEGELYIDWVYQYLDDIVKMLPETTDFKTLYHQLEERSQDFV